MTLITFVLDLNILEMFVGHDPLHESPASRVNSDGKVISIIPLPYVALLRMLCAKLILNS